MTSDPTPIPDPDPDPDWRARIQVYAADNRADTARRLAAITRHWSPDPADRAPDQLEPR